ncbi:MAG: DUF1109 domain-containing protein [Pseudomonadota bacterium]|nr:DUF1109 domain-containing protein [Pseudomonadota bacterium]
MPDNTENLIAGLVADLKPVAPLRKRAGMALAMIALGAGVTGMVLLVGLRADLRSGEPDPIALISGDLFLVLALASFWAVADMARPYVGVRREGWGWTALMAGVLPAAALVLLATTWLHGEPTQLALNGRDCLLFGLGWGMLSAAAQVWWLRRGAPSRPERAGLLVGVGAGAAGIFAVSLYCPHSDLVHIGVWHGLTVVLAGLFGRIAVPRLIAW